VGAQILSWTMLLLKKANCTVQPTATRKVRVAGGGHLDTSVVTAITTYHIQTEKNSNGFRLLPLKGYNVILGCDWIERHNPIGLDIRVSSQNLTIHKEGITRVIFSDFIAPRDKATISASQLEKLCRTEILGYVIQINNVEQIQSSPKTTTIPQSIEALLQNMQTYSLIQ
jgi:hypothetical protein